LDDDVEPLRIREGLALEAAGRLVVAGLEVPLDDRILRELDVAVVADALAGFGEDRTVECNFRSHEDFSGS